MTLKKYLSQFSKEQLIGQIIELNKKYKDVKNYYSFSLNPDTDALTEKTKQTIYECFYPKRGYDLKLQEARKAITDFKKLDPGAEVVIDVMVYYVECGVKFTNDYGDIDDAYYTGMVNMFQHAVKMIKSNELESTFKDRAMEIVEDTEDMGWGFHDDLSDIYHEYFGSDK